MPGVERLLDRFRAAHTQVLGVSVDSKFCHAAWAQSLGGISFPLLADFHPKGKVARSFGLYLDEAGITDRATVVIDAGGTVRHISSVSPSGQRDIAELAALCASVDREHGGALPDVPAPTDLEGEATLYVKSRCGFSAWTLQALANLHLGDSVTIRNVTDDPSALVDLEKLSGKTTAPCLVIGGQAIPESAAIIKTLVDRCAPL